MVISDEESEVDSYTGNLDEDMDSDLDDFVVGADEEEEGASGEAIVLPGAVSFIFIYMLLIILINATVQRTSG